MACQPCPFGTGGGGGDCLSTTYKLDGNLLAVEEVHALEDDAEGALANLLPYSVVHPHDVGRRRRHFLDEMGGVGLATRSGCRVSGICNRVEPSVLIFNRLSWRPSVNGRIDGGWTPEACRGKPSCCDDRGGAWRQKRQITVRIARGIWDMRCSGK